MSIKTKKTKKSKGLRGTNSHGHGFRKKWKGSGHRGGVGMAGTGKRADQKKSMILKKYGSDYFGKRGITSRGTAKDKTKKMNVEFIEKNYNTLMKKFGRGNKLNLSEYKILGGGEINKKVEIMALEASIGAEEKIKKVGGKIEVINKKGEDGLAELDEKGINEAEEKSEEITEKEA